MGNISNPKRIRKLYKKLFERDGNLCHLCGVPITKESGKMKRTLDHVVPRSLGGVNASSNLKLAHKKCNERRGNMLLDDYLIMRALRPRCEK